MVDIKKIRADFPILQQQVHGKDLVYLDNGATTQKPAVVMETLDKLYRTYNANIHRGVHHLSGVCTEEYEESRDTVRRFIHAHSNREIVFTSGTTASINLIAFSFGERYVKEGDEVLVSEMEHHANIVPWQLMCARKGAVLKVLPFDDAGELRLDLLDSLLSERTRMVAVTHVSNVLGTINPIGELIRRAHARNIPVLIDGAQGVQHFEVDVQALDCDFYVFSGHKIYGPTGIGVLYAKEHWLEELPPWQGGGDMVRSVTFAHTTYAELPLKFEAGTANYADAIGLAAALNYLTNIGADAIHAYEQQLSNYAIQQLQSIEGLRLFGTAKERTGVASFQLKEIHSYDIGMILDKLGIAVRTGHLCAQPTVDHYAAGSVVRASWSFYNTFEEIDLLCNGLKRVQEMF